MSQPEICDGKDNNCNNLIDDGYVSVACGSSIGECKQGTTACVAGKVVCNGAVPPTAEICDSKDNNCDTIVDNFSEPCYPPASGCVLATGVCKGVCKLGSQLCTAGKWGACVGYQGPAAEVCNGVDDDCDGVVDNGVGTVCTDYTTCGTYNSCAACAVAPPEICDGKDNDCDGKTDDVYPEKGKICGKSVGECKPGTYACVAGALVCQGEIPGTPEICDGKDNDCNGQIDDNTAGEKQPCWPASFTPPAACPGDTCGECKKGQTKCVGAKIACDGGVGPTPEICDGKDNNCDGQIDENAECPGGASCIEGQCLVPCGGSEFTCPGGTRCVNKWCVPDPCVKAACKPTERCVFDPGSTTAACVEKCSGVSCGQYEKCDPLTGWCADDSCYTHGCPAGETCVGYVCVPDPCPPGKCPANQLCSDGVCYDTCLNITCEKGQVCSKGKCIVSPCDAVPPPCETNYVCKVVDGKATCDPDPCRVISCAKGQICRDGNCVKDPCATSRCPKGLQCKVNSLGEADCQPIPGQVWTTDQLLATGGGGCSCDVGAGAGGPVWLGLLSLLGLVVGRRRR